jgi:hypothetical protein
LIASGLEDLRRHLPRFPEPPGELDWEELFPPELYPTVELDNEVESEIDHLTHTAWRLERLSLGLAPELQTGETHPVQRPGYWPPVVMPPDPDPVAATRHALAADAVVLSGLIASLEATLPRLRRLARTSSAPGRSRRDASLLAGFLIVFVDERLKPALATLSDSNLGGDMPATSKRGSL